MKPAEIIIKKRNEAKKEIEKILRNFTDETGLTITDIHTQKSMDAFDLIHYDVILEVGF